MQKLYTELDTAVGIKRKKLEWLIYLIRMDKNKELN